MLQLPGEEFVVANRIHLEGGIVIAPGVFFERPPPIASGSVYSLYRGSFGSYPRVIMKHASRNRTFESGKTHGTLVSNDIQMMQILSGSENMARIFHHEYTADDVVLAAELYNYNLSGFLSSVEEGMRRFEDLDPVKVFKQMFEALSFMHEKEIIHRDLRMKNLYIHEVSGESYYLFYLFNFLIIYCSRVLATHWLLKVGGLKYSRGVYQLRSAEDSAPEDYDVVVPYDSYSYRSDKYQAATCMYFWLKRRLVPQRSSVFRPTWEGDETYNYKELHMKHMAISRRQ